MTQDLGNVYLDPGSYTSEVVQPQALATGQIPNVLAVVGIGPRVKRSTNENVIRGEVLNEAVTFSNPAPYNYTLIDHGDRKKSNTTLLRNGTDVIPTTGYSYLPATLPSLAGTFNVASNEHITIELDHKGWISIAITASATQSATVIAGLINAALNADPRYGTAYNAVATVVGSTFVVTSPATDATSDIRLITTPAVTGSDCSVLLFGDSPPFIAPTIIQLNPIYFVTGATYVISYVAVDTQVDPLAFSPVTNIIKIGDTANVTSYTKNIDYVLNGNNVDWSANTQATLTGLAGPFNTTTLVALKFALNGLAALTVNVPSGATEAASAIVTALNTALVASPVYGPLYGSVFAVSGSAISVTCPSEFQDEPLARGVNSIIEFFDTPNNAALMIFGITSFPYQTTGVADQPTVGSIYFITYEYVRPTADYNNPSSIDHRFFSESAAYLYTEPLTADNISVNKLAMAVKIAFENNTPQIILIQVNDLNQPGFPSINEVKAGIDAADNNESITELVVLDTRLAVQTYLQNDVTVQSAILEKNYRRGWFGMPRNTAIGDIDSPDTFVYRAQVTLQVPPDSPGRGRFILTAPPNVSKTFTLEDGSEQRVQLDSTYLGLATAALMCSFLSVATSLLRKTLVGFNDDDFQIYQKVERRTLAANGVNVVTLNGGNFQLTDPVTTEQGAGNLTEFVEISAGAQKDKVVRSVDQALDDNIVGIVPSDLGDFINDIKGVIAAELRSLIETGDIARYKDQNGNARDINLQTDMQVFQSPTVPTEFDFRYYFNLRYPAKRMFGQYSVDNPFFAPANSGAQTS